MTPYTPEQLLQVHERHALFQGCFRFGRYSLENESDRTELTFLDEDVPLLFVGIGHTVAPLLYLKHLISSYTHLDSDPALYSNGVFFLGIDHPDQSDSYLNSTCGNAYLTLDEKLDADRLRPHLDSLFQTLHSRRGIHMRSGEIRPKEVKVTIFAENNNTFLPIYNEIVCAALKNHVPYDMKIITIKPDLDIEDVQKTIQNLFVQNFTGTVDVDTLFPTREIYRLLLQRVMKHLQVSITASYLTLDDAKDMLAEDGITIPAIMSYVSMKHFGSLELKDDCMTGFVICECSTELFSNFINRILDIMKTKGPYHLANYIAYTIFLLYDLVDSLTDEPPYYAVREILISLRDKLSRYFDAVKKTCDQLNVIMKFLDNNRQLVPDELPSQWLFHPQSFVEERETLIERVFKEQDICQQFYEHLANDYIHWGGFDLTLTPITQKVANPLTAYMDIDQSLMHFIEKNFADVVKGLPLYDDGFLFPYDDIDEEG